MRAYDVILALICGFEVGGKLRVGSRAGSFEEVETEFKAMGFTRVFEPNAELDGAMVLIAADLDARAKEAK